MNQNALVVQGLAKTYDGFALKDVSFRVPSGAIVGLIGENGAGKTTTLHAILGLIDRDAGDIEILGERDAPMRDSLRGQTGVVFDGNNFPDALTPRRLNRVFQNLYANWREETYFSLLEKMALPEERKIKALSKGMKMKLAIAAALSHDPRLLILDEATSGLDPIARDDILDVLWDFVQDESHSVLLSSHITSDLEKIADYIVFLHRGRVLLEKPKDELRYQYGILKCGETQFAALDRADILAYRKQDYEWDVLVADKAAAQRKYPGAVIDPASIDDIMLLYIKGVQG